jgi:hypothetical protein
VVSSRPRPLYPRERLIYYIQSLLKTEAETAAESLAASSKNFTTDKVQKKNKNFVIEYLFCQKLADSSHFLRKLMCVLFLIKTL